MTTYTIFGTDGSAIRHGASLREAVQMIMTSGGREWEIRKHSDGGFTVWQRRRGESQTWELLPFAWSTATNKSAAAREIFEKIVSSTMFSDLYAAVPETAPHPAAACSTI